MNTNSNIAQPFFVTNYEKLFDDIVNFTYNYIKKSNIKSVVMGISGGIDSTVVAAILYEAVKKYYKYCPEKDFCTFRGFSMPTKTTNNQEYFISTLVGNAFCVHPAWDGALFKTVNIEDIADKIKSFVSVNSDFSAYDDYASVNAFRFGYIKARFRTMFLYDQAKHFNGMVVGTDNYTEYLLGFSTIGGDALADYMPIQYLWKTEVYGLANYLLEKYKNEENWAAVNALNASINIPPQDGLGISTNDMDQIGAKNYFDVDKILWLYEYYKDKDDFHTYVYDYLCKEFCKYTVDKVISRREKNFKLDLPITFEDVLNKSEYE